MTPPQSFVEFEWEPNSQNQEFDQTISLRGDSSRHAADEGGVRARPRYRRRWAYAARPTTRPTLVHLTEMLRAAPCVPVLFCSIWLLPLALALPSWSWDTLQTVRLQREARSTHDSTATAHRCRLIAAFWANAC